MAGREVREYTNLSDPKGPRSEGHPFYQIHPGLEPALIPYGVGSLYSHKKWGKGKDKVDDEDVAFQRMVAKMQEVAGERGGYLHGRGALDSDDLLYLKEQMEAEEDAERLRRRTEKRAFAAFKRAASLADSSPSIPPLRVEPKPKSGIRQQVLLKNILEVKPKRQRVSGHQFVTTTGVKSPELENGSSAPSSTNLNGSHTPAGTIVTANVNPGGHNLERVSSKLEHSKEQSNGGLLGLTYESSDED